MSELLDMRLTITSDFSWKPGFQYRIRNPEMTTSLSQRSTNLWFAHKGHVTRDNFSCNLQRNVCCVASCRKKSTCNTPFCNCNCCVASCKVSRMTLYFSQRYETSCLRVTSPQQLATPFCQNGPANQSSSFARCRYLARPPSCLLLYVLQVAKKIAHV